MSGDIDQPLRIGIGLHSGPTIVGEMGYERATQLTAIGDTVNTASRLETLTKEFGVELVVSQELLDRAGVDLAAHAAPRCRDPRPAGPSDGACGQTGGRSHGNVIRISLLKRRQGKNPATFGGDHALDPSRGCGSPVSWPFGDRLRGRRRRRSIARPTVPKPVDANFTRAKAMIEARDYKGALPLLQQVVARDPRNADAYNLMGYATRAGGDPNGSLQYYQQALAIDPRHSARMNMSARPT